MLNITAVGRLGKDPEQKQSGDLLITKFSMAVNTSKDETTWMDCTVFGNRGNALVQYVSKGQQITISGRGKLETYDKRDGTQGTSLQVIVNDFSLPAKTDAPAQGQAVSSEIPF
jgi:single-strand DNA-binding protein